MRVCIEKATGELIEMQSHGKAQTLTQNALNAGYALHDIEVKEVTPAEWKIIKASIPKPANPNKNAYATLTTLEQRVDFIAQRLGLK